MPVPAFIVEGRAEQKIVQKLCPTAKVMILECNGDHVEISAIAKKIAALTRICGNRNYPIVIEFDREKRDASCYSVRQQLLDELEAIGLDRGQFRIGIADRDMEAWLLYGVNDDGTLDEHCQSSTIDQYEGFSGEHLLRTRLQKKGTRYHKTTAGVDLLSKLSAKNLSIKSESFRAFIEAIKMDCHWLQQ